MIRLILRRLIKKSPCIGAPQNPEPSQIEFAKSEDFAVTIRWYRAMRGLLPREWLPVPAGDEPGDSSLSEGVKRAWWNWISADQNDWISIFTLVGVCIGVQWMLAAFACFGIKSASPMGDQLTQLGRGWYKPDRDIPFYAFGSCVAVLLAIILERTWRRSSARPDIKVSILPSHRVAILLALVPTIPFWLNQIFRSLLMGGDLRRSSIIILMLPGLAAAVTLFLLRGRPSLAAGRAALRAPDAPPRDGEQQAVGLAGDDPVRSTWSVAGRLFDVGMVAFIASLIYTNDWRLISYQTYNQDIFYHWNLYFMGPALGFFHGGALGTDVFTLYTVGWPVLITWLSAFTPFDYSTCAGVFVLCGTLYFALYYLTLRYVVGDALVAAASFLVLVNLQLFHGLPDDGSVTMWSWPSSTVLRSAFDLGFFFMLALQGRSGHSRWMIASAGAVGLGLLFEIDTGLYLLASLSYYLFVTWLHGVRGVGGPWSANLDTRSIAAVAAALISVTAAGLFIASRGTMFSPEFFEGWLEGIRLLGNGISSEPIAKSGPRALAIFVAMVSLSICSMLLPILRRRPGRMGFLDRYMGCWGAYAWCSIVLFVNRSHEWNIFHCILPSGVLAAYLARSILDRSLEIAALARPGSAVWLTSLIRRGAPGLALVIALAALWARPAFRGYPNLWNRPERPTSLGKDLCLMPGVCGFPEGAAEKVREFHAVTELMAEYWASGQSVEIIHRSDPLFYLASGCPPLDRYSPLLENLFTKQQLAGAIDRFRRRKTPHVLILEHVDPKFLIHEAWSAYRDILTADYEIEKRIGGFEVWRLRSAR